MSVCLFVCLSLLLLSSVKAETSDVAFIKRLSCLTNDLMRYIFIAPAVGNFVLGLLIEENSKNRHQTPRPFDQNRFNYGNWIKRLYHHLYWLSHSLYWSAV